MTCKAARWFSFAFIALLSCSALGTVTHAQAVSPRPGSMSLWEARRILAPGTRAHFSFSPDSFQYDSDSKKHLETVRIDLLTAPAVKATCKSACTITDDAGRSLPRNTGTGKFFEEYGHWYALNPDGQSASVCHSDYCRHEAETFAAAFNVLRTFAQNPDAPLRTFPQRAAAWRALATKPPIPEEVTVQRLMAEDAIKENKPGEALNYYENGIELYPTWPEGNFNAALIAAELKYYSDAIEHMQAYLELVPNAADAQAARDKILIWQVKSKQK